MNILIKTIIIIWIIYLLLNFLYTKYIQKKIIVKIKKLQKIIKEENIQKKLNIKKKEYIDFLEKDILLNKTEYFDKKLKNFINLLKKEYKPEIEIKEIILTWLDILEDKIIYKPAEEQNMRKYQQIYRIQNKNIVEKIKNSYSNENRDEDILQKFFYVSLTESIERYIQKKIMSKNSTLSFYRSDFVFLIKNNINIINYNMRFKIDIIKKDF